MTPAATPPGASSVPSPGPPPAVEIRAVRDEAEIDAARALAWEFVAFLRARYPEMGAEIDAYLDGQDFRGMLERFREHFNPPAGECLLALADGAPAGIVMFKPLEDGVSEMNRLFVRASGRGLGIGRRLCEDLIARARAAGYREMRLSALYRHDEALGLYRALGFETCAPFAGGGDGGDERIVFMRLALDPGPARGDG